MIKAKEKPNFTEGAIFGRMILFVIPLILTGLLQIAYNMADNIVVGNFSGDPDALAAVGQTASYNNLILNLFIGLASGAGVVVAQYFGAKRFEELKRTVHTAMLLSVIIGVILLVLGLIVTRPILSLIVKDELLDKSNLYMTIICCGIPAASVYNFGASILRSLGDSKRPLIILALSGLVNVALNLVFIICFEMSVAGVALATVISQYISAVSVVVLLVRSEEDYVALKIRHLRMNKDIFIKILYCGIPAAMQSSIFSIANMVLTGAVSTFPKETITANTIAGNIDGITFTCMNAFTTCAMTFAGQNYGARKKDRLMRVFLYSIIQVTVVGILIAQAELLFADPIANLYISASDSNRDIIISETLKVMQIMLPLYFLCGIMNVMVGYLRGVGLSAGPMISSVLCVVIIRFSWIFFVFPIHSDSIQWLYLCFPITWIVTIIANIGLFIYAHNRKSNNTPLVITGE